MTRRLLNLLTALSLLLFVTACVLQVRSYHRRDNVWYGGRDRLVWMESWDGTLTLRGVAGWPARTGWRWTTSPAGSNPVRLALSGERPLLLTPVDPRASRLRYRSGTRSHTTPDGLPPAGNWPTPDSPHSNSMAFHELVTPHWVAAALAATLPVTYATVALVTTLRRRRAAGKTLCPRCGYDLRATPGRCPECGMSTSSDRGSRHG